MIPYLVGGLGAAVGVIAALWYKWKLARLKGDHKLLKVKHENLTDEFNKLSEKSAQAVKRLREERDGLTEQRNKAQEDLRKCRAESGDPGSVLDALNVNGVPVG